MSHASHHSLAWSPRAGMANTDVPSRLERTSATYHSVASEPMNQPSLVGPPRRITALKQLLRSSGTGGSSAFLTAASETTTSHDPQPAKWINDAIDARDTVATVELKSLRSCHIDASDTTLEITVVPNNPSSHFPAACIVSVSTNQMRPQDEFANSDVVIKEFKLVTTSVSLPRTTVSMRTVVNIASVLRQQQRDNDDEDATRIFLTLRFAGCCDLSNRHCIQQVHLVYIVPPKQPSSVVPYQQQQSYGGGRTALASMMENVTLSPPHADGKIMSRASAPETYNGMQSTLRHSRDGGGLNDSVDLHVHCVEDTSSQQPPSAQHLRSLHSRDRSSGDLRRESFPAAAEESSRRSVSPRESSEFRSAAMYFEDSESTVPNPTHLGRSGTSILQWHPDAHKKRRSMSSDNSDVEVMLTPTQNRRPRARVRSAEPTEEKRPRMIEEPDVVEIMTSPCVTDERPRQKDHHGGGYDDDEDADVMVLAVSPVVGTGGGGAPPKHLGKDASGWQSIPRGGKTAHRSPPPLKFSPKLKQQPEERTPIAALPSPTAAYEVVLDEEDDEALKMYRHRTSPHDDYHQGNVDEDDETGVDMSVDVLTPTKQPMHQQFHQPTCDGAEYHARDDDAHYYTERSPAAEGTAAHFALSPAPAAPPQSTRLGSESARQTVLMSPHTARLHDVADTAGSNVAPTTPRMPPPRQVQQIANVQPRSFYDEQLDEEGAEALLPVPNPRFLTTLQVPSRVTSGHNDPTTIDIPTRQPPPVPSFPVDAAQGDRRTDYRAAVPDAHRSVMPSPLAHHEFPGTHSFGVDLRQRVAAALCDSASETQQQGPHQAPKGETNSAAGDSPSLRFHDGGGFTLPQPSSNSSAPFSDRCIPFASDHDFTTTSRQPIRPLSLPTKTSFVSVKHLRSSSSSSTASDCAFNTSDDDGDATWRRVGNIGGGAPRRPAPILSEDAMTEARRSVFAMERVPQFSQQDDIFLMIGGVLGVEPQSISRSSSRRASRTASPASRSTTPLSSVPSIVSQLPSTLRQQQQQQTTSTAPALVFASSGAGIVAPPTPPLDAKGDHLPPKAPLVSELRDVLPAQEPKHQQRFQCLSTNAPRVTPKTQGRFSLYDEEEEDMGDAQLQSAPSQQVGPALLHAAYDAMVDAVSTTMTKPKNNIPTTTASAHQNVQVDDRPRSGSLVPVPSHDLQRSTSWKEDRAGSAGLPSNNSSVAGGAHRMIPTRLGGASHQEIVHNVQWTTDRSTVRPAPDASVHLAENWWEAASAAPHPAPVTTSSSLRNDHVILWCHKHHTSRNGTGRRCLVLRPTPDGEGVTFTMKKPDGSSWKGPAIPIQSPQALIDGGDGLTAIGGAGGELSNTVLLERSAHITLVVGVDAYNSSSIHRNRVRCAANCVVVLRKGRLVASLEFDSEHDVRVFLNVLDCVAR